MSKAKFVTVTDPSLSRAERRALERSLQERITARTAEETHATETLPRPAVPGKFGPGLGYGGWWNPIGLTIDAHESTSQHIGGIYPFVADGGIGFRGPVLGVDLNSDSLFHFSPWDAYADESARGTFSTNILVLGAYRAGKSGTIKMLVIRSLAYGHQVVVPNDSKGEWVAVAEAIGSPVIRLGGGSGNRLNPLDRGPRRSDMTDDHDEELVAQRRSTILQTLVELVHRRPLTSAEQGAIDEALRRAIVATNDNPTLRTVHSQLEAMYTNRVEDKDLSDAAREPRFVLRRFVDGDLSGLFEDESTVQFDSEAPMVVVDSHELFERSELVAQLASACTTAWIQAVIADRSAKRTRYVIREEGWRDMSSVAQLKMYQQWLKLSRHYGISNVVILHKVRDVDAVGAEGSEERALAYSLIGDIENKFIFRVNRQEVDHLRERLNLPASDLSVGPTLRKGTFLAYVGQFAYLVDAFATSTEWEKNLFSTDEAILDTEHAWDLERVWSTPAEEASVDEWIEAWEG